MSAFQPCLAYVSLTTPAMLAGLGFAAFPIIAHLMSRSARTRRSFPSLELLQQVAAEQARIAKPRHWILLLLRCLAIACIALAFARPVWQSDQSAALASNQSNDVVFLVDTSASMQAKRGGVSRIEFAKVEAARLLDDLRSGRDRAAVVFMGERPTSVFPDLSPNLPALATAVASVEPTFGVAEPQAALALAKQLLRKATGKRRVVILSDMQASNWKAAADAGVSRMLGNNTQVLVVDLVDGPIANVSLGMPRVNPQRPLVGQPVLLTAQVKNHTSQVKQVRVTAEIDQLTPVAKTVVLEPGQARDVAFEAILASEAPLVAQFRLPHDDFEVDDQVAMVARGDVGIPVAILTDDDASREGSASFFVSLALAPFGDRNDRFSVQLLSQRDTQVDELAPHATVFVGYLGELQESAARALVEYAKSGGAVVFFCGPGPVKRNLELLDRIAEGRLLPFQVGPRQSLRRPTDPVQITSGRWRSALLKDFHLASQIALRDIRFAHRRAVGTTDGAAEVLLAFNDGTPALATRGMGRGQWVLANFSPDQSSSDFGKHGAFVALCQILAQNLGQASTHAAAFRVGDAVALSLKKELAGQTEVRAPDNSLVASRSMLQEVEASVLVDATPTPGVYRVASQGRLVDAFAVNLDPVESEEEQLQLADVSADRLNESGSESGGGLGRGLGRGLSRGQGEADAQVVAAEGNDTFGFNGRPLWGWLIVLSFVFGGLELGLLGRWRR